MNITRRAALDFLARGGLAAVQDVGNVGVVHEGQRLPLGLEAGHHLARVHARLEYLHRHLAAQGLLLLRQVAVKVQ